LKNFSNETSAGLLATTTPEPGTLLLMAAGLAGIVALRCQGVLLNSKLS
jgi:hypothetical protein